MKHILLLFVLSLTISFQKIHAQESAQHQRITKAIQKQGKAFIKNEKISSVSIGVMKDGKTYTQHFGELERGKGNVPNDESRYEIGSVTKTMTGYLVAKAVKEGRIDLSTDVRSYLPGDYPNLVYQDQPIMIQHLVTHTAGLPLFLPEELNEVFKNLDSQIPQKYLKMEQTYSKEQFLEDLKQVSLTTVPGTQYAYSNAGAELMGYVLERAYEKELDSLIAESFRDVHQMFQTGIVRMDTQRSGLVRGYWMENSLPSPNQLNTLWASGGGASMSMSDMLRYMELQLSSEDPIVSQSHQVLFRGEGTRKVGYFWNVWTDKYGTSYNHHGGSIGMQNWLFIFPDHQLGISIMTNQSGPETPKLLSKAAKKILKEAVKM
ncbi:MAG: serine hydrolase domain-containing protein [Bacteroidota bacterium]